ncbi:MAG: ABC transporter permease subunit [Clostridiales bacterium]|nr:ABC transporter permease subunit [Clostridiales bacterium]
MMGRYLSMDIRRMLRTRSLYISMLVSLIFLAFFSIASYFVTGIASDMMPGGHGPLPPSEMLVQARKMMNINYFLGFFFTLPGLRLLHMLLALFAAGFLSKEHHTGYLKNMLSIPRMREKWLVSKMVTLLLASLLFYAVFLLACMITVLLFGNAVEIAWGQVGPFMGMQLSVDMALFALIMLVVTVIQTKTAAVISALMLSFNMQGLLYLLLDQIGFLPFRLRDYGMMNLAGQLSLPGSLMSFLSEGEPVTAARLLPLSLGWLAVALLLSWLALRRVDYKG